MITPSAYGLDIDGNTKPDDMGINNIIGPYRPAGGAWSSAHDFINYVQDELALGKLPDGKRLVSEKNLLQRRVPTVPIGETATYGMGLMVDTTYGVTVVHHGGDLIGYHSDWFAIPDAQVGALIFTNADQGVYIRGPFMRRLLEVLYDGRPEAADDVAASAKTLFARIAAERPHLVVPAFAGRRRAAGRALPQPRPRSHRRRARQRRRGVRLRRLQEPRRVAQERRRHDLVHHRRSW